jgi:hypothetical protein
MQQRNHTRNAVEDCCVSRREEKRPLPMRRRKGSIMGINYGTWYTSEV